MCIPHTLFNSLNQYKRDDERDYEIETEGWDIVGKQAAPIRDYETTITLYQDYIATSTTKISIPVTLIVPSHPLEYVPACKSPGAPLHAIVNVMFAIPAFSADIPEFFNIIRKFVLLC